MKRKTAITIISLLLVFSVAITAYAVVTKQKLDQQELYISANYRHALAEFVSGVSDMDTALRKSLMVTSPSMAGAVCTEVYGKTQNVKMAMGILPYSATELEKTTGFIGRVGDYAFSLSRKAAKGEGFSQEEKDNLRALSETASLLAQNLNALQNELGSGLLSMEQYAITIANFDQREGEFIPQTLGDNMNAVEQEFPEVPVLIYDGPFSEHLEGIAPLMLEGKEEISEPEGRDAAAKFLGMRPEQVYPTGELMADIESLCYETKIKESVARLTVSKKGGIVYQVVGDHAVQQAQLSPKEALDAARKFLERRGYTSMRESYYMIANNVLTANFAYEQDGVVCYPDLIKVGIALDDGSLVSFEATGYLKNHRERETPKASITQEEAAGKVPTDTTLLETNKVIIPSAGKNELFCYEFLCQDQNEQRYLIYVNAQTGEQEKIFILLQDDNGSLTL